MTVIENSPKLSSSGKKGTWDGNASNSSLGNSSRHRPFIVPHMPSSTSFCDAGNNSCSSINNNIIDDIPVNFAAQIDHCMTSPRSSSSPVLPPRVLQSATVTDHNGTVNKTISANEIDTVTASTQSSSTRMSTSSTRSYSSTESWERVVGDDVSPLTPTKSMMQANNILPPGFPRMSNDNDNNHEYNTITSIAETENSSSNSLDTSSNHQQHEVKDIIVPPLHSSNHSEHQDPAKAHQRNNNNNTTLTCVSEDDDDDEEDDDLTAILEKQVFTDCQQNRNNENFYNRRQGFGLEQRSSSARGLMERSNSLRSIGSTTGSTAARVVGSNSTAFCFLQQGEGKSNVLEAINQFQRECKMRKDQPLLLKEFPKLLIPLIQPNKIQLYMNQASGSFRIPKNHDISNISSGDELLHGKLSIIGDKDGENDAYTTAINECENGSKAVDNVCVALTPKPDITMDETNNSSNLMSRGMCEQITITPPSNDANGIVVSENQTNESMNDKNVSNLATTTAIELSSPSILIAKPEEGDNVGDVIVIVNPHTDVKTENDSHSSISNSNDDSSSTGSYNGSAFEASISKTIKKQRRLSMKVGAHSNSSEQQRLEEISVLFSCTDQIRKDHTRILNMYDGVHEGNNDGLSMSMNKSSRTADGSVTGDSVDIVDAHLHAASHIVQQFLNIVDVLKASCNSIELKDTNSDNLMIGGKCYPVNIIYNDMEQFLIIQLSLVTSTTKTMKPSHAAKLICWYENFLRNIQLACPADTPYAVKPCSIWKSDVYDLIERYLDAGIRRDVKSLIEMINAKHNTSSPSSLDRSAGSSRGSSTDTNLRRNRAGHIVTSRPEEILYVFHMYVQIAIEQLPEKYVTHALDVCSEILSSMICEEMMNIESNWKHSMTTARFCSVINDAKQLSDLYTEYNSKYEYYYETNRHHLEQQQRQQNQGDTGAYNKPNNFEKFQERTTKIERELTELPLQAMEYMCRHIVYNLGYPDSMSHTIGLSSWEIDPTDGSFVSRAVISLMESFSGIEQWLQSSEYYFPKVLTKCFHYTLQTYVEAFYSNTMKSGIQNAAVVAKNLRRDYSILSTFFNSNYFEKHTRKAKLLSNHEINARMMIVQSMSRIVDPCVSPLDLQEDVRVILERVSTCGESNVTAILHLAGLRGRYYSRAKIESMKWIQTIAAAEVAIIESKRNDTSYADKFSVRLPDLMSSSFIYNISVDQQDIDSQFHDTRIIYAQAVHDLLERGSREHSLMNCFTGTSARQLFKGSSARQLMSGSSSRQIMTASSSRQLMTASSTRQLVKESSARQLVKMNSFREYINSSTDKIGEYRNKLTHSIFSTGDS